MGITSSSLIMEQRKSSCGTKQRTARIPHHAIGTPHQLFPQTRSRKKVLLTQTPTHHIIKHRSKPKTHTPLPTCRDKLQKPPLPCPYSLEEEKSNSLTITQAIGQSLRSSCFNASFFSQQNWIGTKLIWTKFLWSSHT